MQEHRRIAIDIHFQSSFGYLLRLSGPMHEFLRSGMCDGAEFQLAGSCFCVAAKILNVASRSQLGPPTNFVLFACPFLLPQPHVLRRTTPLSRW